MKLTSNVFSTHGCNDVEKSYFNDWTTEEKKNFLKNYFEWHGDLQAFEKIDDYDDITYYLRDNWVFKYFSDKVLNK